MFIYFVQVDRNKHHFFKAFEDKVNDPVSITHVHYNEFQKYLLFSGVIMFNHEFCTMLRWYECMNIFNACTCQAIWIGAHLLDVIRIWFSKPPPEPPDPRINEIIKYKDNLRAPSSELVKEQVKDEKFSSPP